MSDIVLDKVRFKNFMSFGNIWTEVTLSLRGTTFIVGENLDEGGSSGAGKTTAINAISYCLFDRILDNSVSKDQLINSTNNKANTLMEVELYFSSGADKVKIYRFRGEKTGVQMFVNDVDVTSASVNRGEDSFNKKVLEYFGYSYLLFSKIILFEGSSKPFLAESTGVQRAFMEELIKITLLTLKANNLKKKIRETEKAIDLQKLLIQQQEIQNVNHIKRVDEAKDRATRWETAREAEFGQIQAEIQKLTDVDFDVEDELHVEIANLQKEFDSFKGQLDTLSAQSTAKARETSPSQTELAVLTSGLTKKKAELSNTTSQLNHLRDTKCPYCLQKYEDSKSKIVEVEAKEASLTREISLDEEKIKSLSEKVDEDRARIASELAAIKAQLQAITAERMTVSAAIAEVQSAVRYKTTVEATRAKSSIASLNEKFMKRVAEINPHLETVEALSKEGLIEINRDALDGLVKLHDHQKFLVKLLTDKNSYIRKNIISKTIPFMNKRIGYYIEKLNLPHVVLFQSDMSCEISQYGRPLGHGNLSNGEKKRLNLAMCLAFRDTLTYLHSKVNVLFTDEVDGGSMDGNSVDLLVGLLKKKAWDDDLSIFIISHRPEFDGRCDRNLVVRKENGFSVLIDQPDA